LIFSVMSTPLALFTVPMLICMPSPSAATSALGGGPEASASDPGGTESRSAFAADRGAGAAAFSGAFSGFLAGLLGATLAGDFFSFSLGIRGIPELPTETSGNYRNREDPSQGMRAAHFRAKITPSTRGHSKVPYVRAVFWSSRSL
jgi:hypothetical protein